MMDNKKAQTNVGLIITLVMGIAGLIIGIIIALLIVSTLSDANLLETGRTDYSVTNESGGTIDEGGYILDKCCGNNLTFTITEARNITGGLIILAGNYTVDSATGNVTNLTTTTSWTDVNFSYTYVEKSEEEITTAYLNANFTEGIDDVAIKIPTVMLVAAIILIMGILVFLIDAWRRMSLGAGASL